ncbi:Abi family protein [Dellaglioa carnosa]|uniref:Abi family protein n=1 Tax=Dellaglioa carnosa TaxID=2995136 RepID=UPI0022A875BA|nr:Abi family protein [Dellaglioa carnosa]MCZ2492472.1 Abi family protein [Dellaglioa carnosa]
MTDKPFKTITEQIEILRARNLTFIDEVTAAQYLAANGYYEIINGYKTTFLTDDNETFKDGTTFEDIFALYYFDTKIRTAVMSSIDFIESFLKQKLAYLLAEKHGEQFTDYVSKEVFSSGNTLKHPSSRRHLYTDRDLLFNKFAESANRNYDPFKHYKLNHKNTPPWILVKDIDFGCLRTAIKLLNKDDKRTLIARIFSAETIANLSYEQLNVFFGELILIINK